MKCEKCQKNEAVIHYGIQINGDAQDMHLCASCAGQMGLDATVGVWPGFLSHFFDGGGVRLRQEEGCPLCGRTPGQIRETGRLGCSRCYEYFAPQTERYIGKLYGSARHQGKIPQSAGEELRGRRRLEELNARLQDAVARQDYEQAAVLRDEIKELRGGEGA